jgi:hypothetical protein
MHQLKALYGKYVDGLTGRALPAPRAKSSKNSKANRMETGERSGGIGEICSVEVDEK